MSLPKSLKIEIESILCGSIFNCEPISGGSIHHAYSINSFRGLYFIKFNTNPQSNLMFQTEERSLELLEKTKTINIPKIFCSGTTSPNGTSTIYHYLWLEYIEKSEKTAVFWEKFGKQLAALHRNTNSFFGLNHDNFIGSLPQSNLQKDNWIAFFIQERLLPQIQLAEKSKKIDRSTIHSFERLFKKLDSIFPKEVPALLHGDLWSGNFLCDDMEEPYLIDPAVYYGHREMDLAMTRLFGGFDPIFYHSYQNAFPLSPGFEKRCEVYQLYYLMVHVNLFGGSYLDSVKDILRRFA